MGQAMTLRRFRTNGVKLAIPRPLKVSQMAIQVLANTRTKDELESSLIIQVISVSILRKRSTKELPPQNARHAMSPISWEIP